MKIFGWVFLGLWVVASMSGPAFALTQDELSKMSPDDFAKLGAEMDVKRGKQTDRTKTKDYKDADYKLFKAELKKREEARGISRTPKGEGQTSGGTGICKTLACRTANLRPVKPGEAGVAGEASKGEAAAGTAR